MKNPTHIVNIGIPDRLFREEVMRHKSYLICQRRWYLRPGVSYDMGQILHDATKRWTALSDGYTDSTMRASDIDDRPIPEALPRVVINDVNWIMRWIGLKPAHGICVTLLTCRVFRQLIEANLLSVVCQVKPLVINIKK